MLKKEDILGNPSITKINKTPLIESFEDARTYTSYFFEKKYQQISATHPLLHDESRFFLKLETAIINEPRSIVQSLRDTIAALEVFEEDAKKSKYQKTRCASAIDWGGNPYIPLIDLCKKLLSIFAINHFRNELIYERIKSIHVDEKTALLQNRPFSLN